MVTLKYFNEVISRWSEALKKGIDALIFMGLNLKTLVQSNHYWNHWRYLLEF